MVLASCDLAKASVPSMATSCRSTSVDLMGYESEALLLVPHVVIGSSVKRFNLPLFTVAFAILHSHLRLISCCLCCDLSLNRSCFVGLSHCLADSHRQAFFLLTLGVCLSTSAGIPCDILVLLWSLLPDFVFFFFNFSTQWAVKHFLPSFKSPLLKFFVSVLSPRKSPSAYNIKPACAVTTDPRGMPWVFPAHFLGQRARMPFEEEAMYEILLQIRIMGCFLYALVNAVADSFQIG